MEKLGDAAAFGTAICWTASAIFFENASRRIGALAVNFTKVIAATFLLGIASFALRGMPLPLDAPARAWIFLPISGIIGFVVADYFLFNAYILISSRVTVLFQALTPLFTAALGWAILGETIRPFRLLAMVLVLTGIVTVVRSRNPALAGSAAGNAVSVAPRHLAKGYIFAFFSSLFQAIGLIFSKLGLGGYDAVSGTQIRTMTAVLGFAVQVLVIRQAPKIALAWKDRPAMRNTAIGSIFGPFLGVTLSLFALQNTSAGSASTLMALTPVLIIPPSILLLKQKIKAGEMVGAALAVAGAASFFLL
jgi:drug/metabolite transporter (DMT)-like permease